LTIKKASGWQIKEKRLNYPELMTIPESLSQAYDQRDFAQAPPVYRDQELIQKILDATGLPNFPGQARVGDFMSGPGKLGLALQQELPDHHYFFLDFAQNQLGRIPPDNLRVAADVRFPLPFASESLDVIVCRYGLKDLPATDQPQAVARIAKVLKPGGIFVIADMYAPAPEVKDWLNQQHRLKQELGGRNPDQEGVCHIPTREEWCCLLTDSGFKAAIFDYHTSHVNTQAWVDSHQVTPEQLAQLKHLILTAPSRVRACFEIESPSHPHWLGKKDLTLEAVAAPDLQVEITYPTIIIQAIKNDPQ
jgi:SAM-dependent methyltransferase